MLKLKIKTQSFESTQRSQIGITYFVFIYVSWASYEVFLTYFTQTEYDEYVIEHCAEVGHLYSYINSMHLKLINKYVWLCINY